MIGTIGAHTFRHSLAQTLNRKGKASAQFRICLKCLKAFGVPDGIRTRVTAVKGRCPGPLDDGDASQVEQISLNTPPSRLALEASCVKTLRANVRIPNLYVSALPLHTRQSFVPQSCL